MTHPYVAIGLHLGTAICVDTPQVPTDLHVNVELKLMWRCASIVFIVQKVEVNTPGISITL